MPTHIRRMPFQGTPPEVADGDLVEVRDAAGNWHTARCGSGARYDTTSGLGRTCWLTVRVDAGNGWVNWPAEDVRLAVRHAQLAQKPEETL